MPGKKSGSGRTRQFPGIAPTARQLQQKIGKREEDGSFSTRAGVFDPDTGQIRPKRGRR